MTEEFTKYPHDKGLEQMNQVLSNLNSPSLDYLGDSIISLILTNQCDKHTAIMNKAETDDLKEKIKNNETSNGCSTFSSECSISGTQCSDSSSDIEIENSPPD